jgi:hypothetical protein
MTSSKQKERMVYLGLDVLEGRRRDEGEADEEDVGLRVGQRTKTVVILLSGGIPETEVDGLSIDHDIGRVVVKAVYRIIGNRNKCGDWISHGWDGR